MNTEADPSSDHDAVMSRSRQLIVVASTVADQIMDLLSRLSLRRPAKITGIVQEQALLEGTWDSYATDRQAFAMALDFEWHRSGSWRLLRTGGAWVGLEQAVAADPRVAGAFTTYLSARHQGLKPESVISVRTPPVGTLPRYGALARAIEAAGLTSQFKSVEGDWNDYRSIGGYCLLGNEVAEAIRGWRPASGIRPTFPVWQSILDEPGLLLCLSKAYPHDAHYPVATIADNGRTLADGTGISMRNVPEINVGGPMISLDAPKPIYRAYVSQGGVWGLIRISNASIRDSFSGAMSPFNEA